jgi:hypothetical protein
MFTNKVNKATFGLGNEKERGSFNTVFDKKENTVSKKGHTKKNFFLIITILLFDTFGPFQF